MPIHVEDITIDSTRDLDFVEFDLTNFFDDVPDVIQPSVDLRISHPDIVKPIRQMECGMCWAISVATAIDDVALVWGKHPPPHTVSPTLLMLSFPQMGCLGGSVVRVGNSIMERGHVVAGCAGEDYVESPQLGWCARNPRCSAGSLFSGDSDQYINTTIPKQVVCEDGSQLDVTNAMFLSTAVGYAVGEVDRALKRIVTNIGPFVVNVVVYKNFAVARGVFARLPGFSSVYVDDIDYEYYAGLGASPAQPLSNSNIYGTHSMCVVGYGVETNAKLPDGRVVASLPYWVVRNSWGTGWADGGFARVAAFPFCTKGCVIGVNVKTVIDGKVTNMGGALAFKTGALTRNKYTRLVADLLPGSNGTTSYTGNEPMRVKLSTETVGHDEDAPPPRPRRTQYHPQRRNNSKESNDGWLAPLLFTALIWLIWNRFQTGLQTKLFAKAR